MYTSRKRILKVNDVEPTEFEESVAQAFFDLGNSNQDLKSDLNDLYINSAMQVHVKLVRELEKKFSGKVRNSPSEFSLNEIWARKVCCSEASSRTLTAVHEPMLEDIVLPAEIVGKRTRYRIDGSKIMKVYLDPKERNNTEYKLETFLQFTGS
ncbi:40S ribosomal protein S7 [Hibiscus syriacus]|uniref:40S ribosomal protein S7 n=1 Tax=Hibiscus syriacus TaxID=106335 RepID=A0A6A3BN36_HIBSY|nr:40S ribosomal protein S7 [Hibiscus syriacus]